MRRSDLNASPQSSRASSPDLDTLQRLGATLQFELVDTVPQQSQPAQDPQEDEEEELEFQLFAPTKSTTTTTNAESAPAAQKIRLRSPSIEAKDPGLVTGPRPLSYYHTGDIDPSKAEEYAAVAVTGADIVAWSKQPCPGCAYPWKVINMPASQAKAALAAAASQNAAAEAFLPDVQKKRTRLGKKARIKKRQKLAVTKAKKEEENKLKEEKDRADREKKAKRNREKKFKKRARDKAKKAAGKEGDQGGGADEDVSDSESDKDVDMTS